MALGAVAPETLQVRSHIGCVLIAQAPIFFQGFANDLFQLHGEIGVEAHRRNRSAIQDGFAGDSRAFPAERRCGRRHFVQNRAEGKQIGSRIELSASHLLRGHVSYSSQHRPRTGQIFLEGCHPGLVWIDDRGGRRHHFGQAEVENLGLASPRDKNVCGLDIAMNHAGSVGRVECVGDLDRNWQKNFRFERPSGDAVAQGHTVQEFHDDERSTLLLSIS